MVVELVVGTQWGDEGKGKMVDLLAETADMVVRYGGGANAGHTIVADGETYKFHLLPSGAVRGDKVVALGNGMVVDPGRLIEEMLGLESRGKTVKKIFIDERAHVILPYHKTLDSMEEAFKAKQAGKDSTIGTTRRGIGPAYTSKVRRTGIRFCDLASQDDTVLKEKLDVELSYVRGLLSHLAGGCETNMTPPDTEIEETLDPDSILAICAEYRKILGDKVTDVGSMVAMAREEGKSILLEGAQGAMLDIDHGTYPYVTSSNPTAGGACTGTGIGPRHIDRVMGVVKAYTTRVGGGPMVTELEDEVGARMRDVGGEYGTTTSRPRRCGWLDLVVLRKSARLNSLDSQLVTKIDVLGDIEELKVCTHYEIGGEMTDLFPADLNRLGRCEPVYATLPGWKSVDLKDGLASLGADGKKAGGEEDGGTDTPGIRAVQAYQKLPDALKNYVQFMADNTGVQVDVVSVGPDRVETFDLRAAPVTPNPDGTIYTM